MSRRPGGFSLMEVLIASTLMLLTLAIAASAFASFTGYIRRVRARTELQQQSIFIMSNLTRDLGEANPLRVYSPAGSNSVVFPQPRELGGDVAPSDPDSGDLTWGRIVCYRVDADRRLFRQMEALPLPYSDIPPDIPLMSPPRDMAYFAGQSSLPIRPFRGDVVKLSAETGTGEVIKIDLTLSVEVQDQVYELDNFSKVTPRN